MNSLQVGVTRSCKHCRGIYEAKFFPYSKHELCVLCYISLHNRIPRSHLSTLLRTDYLAYEKLHKTNLGAVQPKNPQTLPNQQAKVQNQSHRPANNQAQKTSDKKILLNHIQKILIAHQQSITICINHDGTFYYVRIKNPNFEPGFFLAEISGKQGYYKFKYENLREVLP